jgi:hypothetical protein
VVDLQASDRGARIGDILVEQGKLPAESLKDALRMQQRKPTRLGEVLVEMGILNEQQLSAALAKRFHMHQPHEPPATQRAPYAHVAPLQTHRPCALHEPVLPALQTASAEHAQ